MRKSNFYPLILGAVVALSFMVTSCGNKGDVFTQAGIDVMNPQYISENIRAYQMKDVECPGEEDCTMNVYIDFSNGLWQAYRGNANNSGMISSIAQNLTGSVNWYKVGSKVIEKMDFPNTELYNKVVDVTSYSSEIMAPIQENIKQIVENNQEALFVTDFEEYTADGKEQFLGFAKDYFIDWVKKGNTIDFYVTNYSEKCRDGRTVGKHLYFIIFSTPAQQLKSKIDYALKGRSYTYETFNLSRNFFTLTNEYPSASKGGNYYDNSGRDVVSNMNESQYVNGVQEHFEFYPFQESWSNIYVNSKGLMEPDAPKPFTHLFRNLFINLKNDDIFTINGLSVRVYDVTDDYKFFAQANEAKKHAPKMTKDESGNLVVDEGSSDEIALKCYDSKGDLKAEWNYSPKNVTELPEVFALDQHLFNNSKSSNPEKTEIGVVYHPNFTGSLPNPGALLRVDIVVDKCEPNFDKLSGLFSWASSTQIDTTNESLMESIRNTLGDSEVNPEGRVVYSFFIKAAEK